MCLCVCAHVQLLPGLLGNIMRDGKLADIQIVFFFYNAGQSSKFTDEQNVQTFCVVNEYVQYLQWSL